MEDKQLAELAQLARSGDHEAFEQLYVATIPQVYRTLYVLFKTTKSRIHVPSLSGQHIERTAVRGQDAVYMSDSGRQHLIWAEEESGASKAVQYELIAQHSDREWLFRIANSVGAWEGG